MNPGCKSGALCRRNFRVHEKQLKSLILAQPERWRRG
jgi:hypothetical protein